jgi:hypothetical protein
MFTPELGTEAQEDWATVIGQYMMAFAWLERSVNSMIRLFEVEDKVALVIKKPLSQRIDRLRALAARKRMGAAARLVLNENLDELLDLNDTRNHIAHNPVDLDLEGLLDANIYDPWPQLIKKVETDEVIMFPELKMRLERAKHLQVVLYQNDGVLMLLGAQAT